MQRRIDTRPLIEPRLPTLNRDPDFDLDLYREACAWLSREEVDCRTLDDLQRRSHDWFRDAFFPSGKESRLEQQTAIPPLAFAAATEARFLRMPAGGLFSTWDMRRMEASLQLNGALYGDRLFANIGAGLAFSCPADHVDLLGTGELDCCSAIAGIRRNGSLFLAHIPGPHLQHLQQTVRSLGAFELERAFLLHPIPPSGIDQAPEKGTREQELIQGYADIAERFGMRPIGFLSSSLHHDHDDRRFSGLRTLATINRDGLCVSLNRETATRRVSAHDGRQLQLHYAPLAVGTFSWEDA